VKARSCYERSLAIRRDCGDLWGIANTLRNLGYTAQAEHDPSAARQYQEEGLALMRSLNNPTGIGYALHGLGSALLDLGDISSARSCVLEGLELKLQLGDNQGLILLIEVIARLKLTEGEFKDAARLYAFTDSMRAKVGYPRSPKEQAIVAQEIERVRDSLTAQEFEQSFSTEEGVSVEQIVSSLLHSTAEVSLQSQ
jgi:hypothetical protein